MNKKSKRKGTAKDLFISGFLALILGFVLLAVANNVKEEAGYIDSEERKAIDLAKGFSIFMFVDAGIEIFAAIIIAALADQESDNNDTYINTNSYNRYNYSDRVPESVFWICPKCKRENANYVGSCACGENKPAAKNILDIKNESVPLKYCPSCGQKVAGQQFCGSCGYKLN